MLKWKKLNFEEIFITILRSFIIKRRVIFKTFTAFFSEIDECKFGKKFN